MKKVLVTGAAGTIGMNVIKYLLSEGKYEITVLDLKNQKVHSVFKKYKKRINTIYGDVCDRILIEALIKDHDIIIHLASVLPPIADLKKGLMEIIEYEAIEAILRAINYYNPKCHLIYASTTSVYGTIMERPSVKNKVKTANIGYYVENKIKCENLIKNKIKNYTILRLPLVLSYIKDEPFIFNIPKNELINCITKEDAAYAFVKTLNHLKLFNKKIINLGGNSTFNITYNKLIQNIIEIYGFNFKLFLSDLFIEKNYHSPICADIDDLNDILNYQNDNLDNYFNRLKRKAHKRKIARFFGKFYNYRWGKKK